MEDIGNFVSIICINEARIEGILDKNDLTNGIVVVKNAMDYGSEGRKARGPQIPPALNIQGSLTIRSRQIKVRFLETSKEQEKRANSDLVYDSLFQDMEIICLTPQERDFPSLSRRRIGARNNVGPSYSEVAKKKKN